MGVLFMTNGNSHLLLSRQPEIDETKREMSASLNFRDQSILSLLIFFIRKIKQERIKAYLSYLQMT